MNNDQPCSKTMSQQNSLDEPDLSINPIGNSYRYDHMCSEIFPDRSKEFLNPLTYNHYQEVSLIESDRAQNNFELTMRSREHTNSLRSELEVISSIDKRTDADTILSNTFFVGQQPGHPSSDKCEKNMNTSQGKITNNKFPHLQHEADEEEKILPTEFSGPQEAKMMPYPDRLYDEIKDDVSMPSSIKINLSQSIVDEEEEQQALPEKILFDELEEANKRETSRLKKTKNLGANSLKANREESFENIQKDQKSGNICRFPSQKEERRKEQEEQHPEEEECEISVLINQMQQTPQDNRSTNTVITRIPEKGTAGHSPLNDYTPIIKNIPKAGLNNLEERRLAVSTTEAIRKKTNPQKFDVKNKGQKEESKEGRKFESRQDSRLEAEGFKIASDVLEKFEMNSERWCRAEIALNPLIVSNILNPFVIGENKVLDTDQKEVLAQVGTFCAVGQLINTAEGLVKKESMLSMTIKVDVYLPVVLVELIRTLGTFTCEHGKFVIRGYASTAFRFIYECWKKVKTKLVNPLAFQIAEKCEAAHQKVLFATQNSEGFRVFQEIVASRLDTFSCDQQGFVVQPPDISKFSNFKDYVEALGTIWGNDTAAIRELAEKYFIKDKPQIKESERIQYFDGNLIVVSKDDVRKIKNWLTMVVDKYLSSVQPDIMKHFDTEKWTPTSSGNACQLVKRVESKVASVFPLPDEDLTFGAIFNYMEDIFYVGGFSG